MSFVIFLFDLFCFVRGAYPLLCVLAAWRALAVNAHLERRQGVESITLASDSKSSSLESATSACIVYDLHDD